MWLLGKGLSNGFSAARAIMLGCAVMAADKYLKQKSAKSRFKWCFKVLKESQII
jgi:hypothetical protein